MMASQSSASSERSRPHSSRPPSSAADDHEPEPGDPSEEFHPEDVPVEVLVKHLLGAKQSLSSMALVLRANDLATHARQMHEESVILSAQTGFLRHGIHQQMLVLSQVRRGLNRSYDRGKREFKQLLCTLDDADARLQQTIDVLRNTVVESAFRPPGEESKCLMDFVDEKGVDTLRNALKENIAELQSVQTSFDGDLLRFDDDLRALTRTLSPAKSRTSPSSSATAYQPMPHLLAVLTDHSHAMAQHLTSLTRHFDMCVTAVRSTEGGAALARRRAADMTESNGDPVSISGVITEQESHRNFDMMDPSERAEIVQVVVKDAPEVDEVVAEIQAVLQRMELEFGNLKEQADTIRGSYISTLNAFQALEEIGARLQGYIDAETEFSQRWDVEREAISGTLQEMGELSRFYEGYASAYDTLRFEAERRKAVEEKIQYTLRKAKESVENLMEADVKEREHFQQEVGEYIPTDLWVGMNDPLRKWDIVPVYEDHDLEGEQEPNTPTLPKASLFTPDVPEERL
ncbi:autophagy-related protein 17 [Podospora australis]|uniref:Autophagy-related protein 17 n=1 Tax=Podospora australis TaxID=1536484 RepID=A0AAN6WNA9_9PEZI|nr:autophagy-related protein 17 [Podospora australis]